MRKLILKNFLSPGDIVMLTAAVRDLHRCYPEEFQVDVRTYCQALWENNPYLTPLDEHDPEVTILDCDYPLIRSSNQVPYHCLHGFIHFLNGSLGLAISPTEFRGDIHISTLEKSWFSQIHELTGEDTPYWIVVAGGKFDVTIKWWETKRYEEVIEHFKGKIQFVQVGESGHHHPRLNGVIDLRGKTDLRQFVRLVYHSQGVLCGVTAAMHLAAAVETKPSLPANRPCVVVAGGREPVHWEAYPHHQFIHTVGQLSCCAHGGCWRARTLPLGDGDERDNPDRLCVDVVGNLPRCMDMIPAAEVIRRIENYYDGGVLRYLSDEQRVAALKGVDATSSNPFLSGKPTLRLKRNARSLIIQQGSGFHSKMLDLTHQRHSAYAESHAFTFWSVRGDVQQDRHPSWNKVVLIQMGLAAGFDFIVWLDADTVIVKTGEDLRNALPSNGSIGMCKHPLPLGEQPWHFNAGVIFLRRTEIARRFIDKVWDQGPPNHVWHEQLRMNELSQQNPGLVQQVDDIWNSTENANSTADPVIRAWHGQGEAAIKSMEAALTALLLPKQLTTPKNRLRNGTERLTVQLEPSIAQPAENC
ncbi:MAG TPA: glycosyltransferase family 9 protein [Candidatus Kapabacteria bacterium]|nr:glycosyltransferase family 9 protein [Candidatus Kapabacteria bacterium]